MKNVTCINPKGYKLTSQKGYSVRTEGVKKGYYEVINDAGRQALYASSLFNDAEENTSQDTASIPEPAQVPAPAPEPVVDTDAQIISTIRSSVTEDNVVITYTENGNNRRLLIPRLGESGTSISCGVRQMDGLNIFTDRIITNTPNLSLEVKQAIVNRAYQANVNECDSCAMMLLSTNTNHGNASYTIAALDALAETTSTNVNPNGGNEIKLWVIDVADNFDTEDDEGVYDEDEDE